MDREDIQDEMEDILKRAKAPSPPDEVEQEETAGTDEPGAGDEFSTQLEIIRKRRAARKKQEEQEEAVEDVAEEPAPEEPEEEARIYVVEKGDSLWKIAEKVYGDGSRWKEIHKANKDRIEDPEVIRPGWKLRIP